MKKKIFIALVAGLLIGFTCAVVMAQSRPVEWIINQVYNSSTEDINVIEN